MSSAERPYQFYGVTSSLCSTCGERVEAKIVARAGSVYLLKYCPAHGEHQELLEEDAAWYTGRLAYDKPGNVTLPQTARARGCPDDCGLCPDHEQHTCIALIEITNRCDRRCPVCYAGAGEGDFLDLDTISRMLDAYQEAEGGKAEVLQISGGEPTLHPRLLEIIALARAKGIRYVMLNTNGRRLAAEPEFAAALGQFVGGFEVYLQFDGFERATYLALRGEDLGTAPLRAVENLAAARVPMTLVTTVRRGVNEHELGRIFDFGLRATGVRGMNFQPVAFFGRVPEAKPGADRVTLSGVLKRLEEQTAGMLGRRDFIPLPCDVDRVAVAFLYRKGREFIPLLRHTRVRDYLPLVQNTLAYYPEEVLGRLAEHALAGSELCACLSFLRDFLPLAPLGAKALLSKDRVALATDAAFRVTVTMFLDRFNFEARAMKKECVHVLTPDGRRIPFSAYNLRYREGALAPSRCDG